MGSDEGEKRRKKQNEEFSRQAAECGGKATAVTAKLLAFWKTRGKSPKPNSKDWVDMFSTCSKAGFSFFKDFDKDYEDDDGGGKGKGGGGKGAMTV
jgi:hypothetical protein